MLEVKVRGTWLPDILSTLTGDSLGPSELVVNKQEVEYESTQYEQYTVEILPGWLTDDRGQHQKNGDENHQDRDDDGDLQAERQHVSRTALVPSETEKPHRLSVDRAQRFCPSFHPFQRWLVSARI